MEVHTYCTDAMRGRLEKSMKSGRTYWWHRGRKEKGRNGTERERVSWDLPSSRVSGMVPARASFTSKVLTHAQDCIKESRLCMPPCYFLTWQCQPEENRKSVK